MFSQQPMRRTLALQAGHSTPWRKRMSCVVVAHGERPPTTARMPQPGERLTLEAVELLTLRAQRDGGWCAAQVRVDQGPSEYRGRHLMVSGVIPGAAEGRWFAVELSFAPHATYGPQWRIERAVPATPMSARALTAYLASCMEGIGPKRAAELVARFGDRLPAVLGAPDAEKQVIAAGILKAKIVRKLVASWREIQDQARTDVTLLDAGCSMGQIARIRARFGAALSNVLASDPYRLVAVRGVTFTHADTVARALGIAADHPRRVVAAAAHLLQEAADDGHCWTAWDELVPQVAALLTLPHATVLELLATQVTNAATTDHALVIRDQHGRCWLRGLWFAHTSVLTQAGEALANKTFTVDEYLTLLDATGRLLKAGKRGAIPPELAPILARLDLSVDAWLATMLGWRMFAYTSALGHANTLGVEAAKRGLRWIRNRCPLFIEKTTAAVA